MRYKTGRTVHRGARVTQRACDVRHAIVAEERARYDCGDVSDKATLGEIVDDALAVLLENEGESGSPNRG